MSLQVYQILVTSDASAGGGKKNNESFQLTLWFFGGLLDGSNCASYLKLTPNISQVDEVCSTMAPTEATSKKIEADLQMFNSYPSYLPAMCPMLFLSLVKLPKVHK